jgi:hypothetical protein
LLLLLQRFRKKRSGRDEKVARDLNHFIIWQR